MTMTKNFNDLNETFNTSDDIVQPEVIERKIEKVKEGVDDIKKDYEEIDTRLASGWYVDDINTPKKKFYKTKKTTFKISKKSDT